MQEEKINQILFKQMPTIMYHGCVGNSFTLDNFKNKIKIFDDINEYNTYEKEHLIQETMKRKIVRQSCGRTNLDAAYHGFYLTPSYEEAYKWATRMKGYPGQIIKIKIDKQKLIENHCKVLCFPNEEWGEFVIRNRMKNITMRNVYKCSYTLRADGKMRILNSKIQKNNATEVALVVKELVHSRLLKYMKINKIAYLEDEEIKNGKLL